MSWLVSAKQYIPAVIGEPFGGGYFAGYISHTADGNPTHALIVAPRATGATGTGYTLTTNLQWKTTNTATAGTTSLFDGVANTAAIIAAGIADHPAAEFCVNLNIGGFTDWYLPAQLELDIAYFNLKPSTAVNVTTYGTNAYSVPRRTANYTLTYPQQSFLADWTSGAQAFIAAGHWSSRELSASIAYAISFVNGNNLDGSSSAGKTITGNRTRAFRRITL
jgi:hypothetical protein